MRTMLARYIVVVGLALAATVVHAQADLAVALDAAPNPAHPGDMVNYTLTVTNLGPAPHPEAFSAIILPQRGF